MLIGDRVRAIREAKKLSQGDIEKRSGLVRTYISRVENGHIVPSVETLEKLAPALEVPIYKLFYEGNERPELPHLSRGKLAGKITWGTTPKEIHFWQKLRELLACFKRLQPTTIRGWSTTGTAFDLAYNFNLGTSDNGNVIGITNNSDGTRSQAFTYDSLNRILVGETTSTYKTSPSHCWGETYVYDNQSGGGGAWGNLTNINVASTAYNNCVQESFSVTVNAQNRISSSGYVYDTAGNLTNAPNPGGLTAQYNAENQVTSVAGVTYTYDGDGKRLKKSSGTLYWYGMGSDALDETDINGNLTNEYMFFGGKRIARRDSSSNVYYYFEDHLGTSRVITNATGTICYDADFYPYGGERTPLT